MAKILLVEDDNNLREIYEARLAAEGYDIVAARDGEEALTVAMKERPDLIISDVMMPKISGFDMLDIIRSTEETKDAKVIMMTALSQAEDKDRADKLGADRYLVKSQVTLEDVARVAREVLAGETQSGPNHEDKSSPELAKQEPTTTTTPTSAAATTTPQAPAVAANPAVAPAPEPDTSTSVAETTPVQEPDVADEPTSEPVAATAPAVVPAPAVPTPDPSTTVTSTTDPVDTSKVPDQAPTTPTPVPAPTPAPAAEESVLTEPAATTTADETAAAVTDEPTAFPEPSIESASAEEQQNASPPSVATEAVATSTPPKPEVTPEDESSAIAKQIESFIESKANTASTPVQPAPEDSSKPDEKSETSAEENDKKTTDPNANIVGKKVIQPIGDPLASAAPHLEELFKEEQTKEQMAKIAQELVAKKTAESSDVTKKAPTSEVSAKAPEPTAAAPVPIPTPAASEADEKAAMEALKQAAEHKSEPQSDPDAPNEPESAQNIAQSIIADTSDGANDLVVGADGQLTIGADDSVPTAAKTTPDAEEPVLAVTAPVIPHQNGVSMDGVVPSSTPHPSAAPTPLMTTVPAPEPIEEEPDAPLPSPATTQPVATGPVDPNNIAL